MNLIASWAQIHEMIIVTFIEKQIPVTNLGSLITLATIIFAYIMLVDVRLFKKRVPKFVKRAVL